MKRLKTELNALVNRGVDRHLRLAVTGLSRSGKTAFITALVNQLLNIHTGARLPLLSAAREERLLGVKRVPQRDFGIPRFTYDEGLAQLYGQPPMWPTPTRGVSEIRLALRYRSNDSLLRHFKDTSTLYLEIVDYPGEWLLDLPMLAQDYLSWSRQMTGLLQGQRAEWSARWRQLCAGLDPLAPADEARLADIAAAWTDYLHACKREGLHFIQPGRFVLPGEMAGAPATQPPSAIQSWVCQALAVHCTPCATTLTPKIASPALTIRRHRLRLGRRTDSTTASAAPSSSSPVTSRAGAKLSASRVSKARAPFSGGIFSACSGPSKSIRGFNGSLIAVYLQSKIPAPRRDECAAKADRHP